MSTYNVSGNHNIIGNHNVAISGDYNKIGDVDALLGALVKCVEASSNSEDQKEQLLQAVSTLRAKDSAKEKKLTAATMLRDFVKGIPAAAATTLATNLPGIFEKLPAFLDSIKSQLN